MKNQGKCERYCYQHKIWKTKIHGKYSCDDCDFNKKPLEAQLDDLLFFVVIHKYGGLSLKDEFKKILIDFYKNKPFELQPPIIK